VPTINALAFDLADRELRIADIARLAQQPPDDLPFLSSHSEVANLVGSGNGPHAFRAQDFLGITTVWQHSSSAAIVYFFYRRRLVLADLILLGKSNDDDVSALQWAQERFSLSVEETERIAKRRRPALARFLTQHSKEGNADLMSLLIAVPVLCELNEFD